MQPETVDERLVAVALRAVGFEVARIRTGTAPSCDFLVRDAQARYLLEVKGRADPEELWTTTKAGEMYESARDLDRSNRVGAIVDNAMRQLKETCRREPAEFMLVAFVIRPVFSRDAEFRRVMETLYGMQELLDLGADFKSHTEFTCLYFRESCFFRHKDLNGAIVFVGSEQWTLCVNDCASNAQRFRESKLYQQFALGQALFDPVLATREPRYLMADFDMPRSDPGAVQSAVRRKYGLERVVLCNPVEWLAVVAIPTRDGR